MTVEVNGVKLFYEKSGAGVPMLLLHGNGEAPALLIFSSCPGLINDLKAICADERNPGDCAKQPHDVTHAVDALRYFAVSRAVDFGSANEDERHISYARSDFDEYMLGF